MFAKAVALSLLTLASTQVSAAECAVDVDSTDQMTFDTKAIQVPKSCKTFTVNLKHSGQLSKAVMGHNWVLSRTEDFKDVATEGMSASVEQSYLKADDNRVLAFTQVIGAGEKTSVTFDVAKLDPATGYTFFCSFPGHAAMMQGALTLVE
jgi:azurin